MGFFSKLFGKKQENSVAGMENYMTLIRVYFQAAIAENVGITNLAALPDLRVFKTTLHVPTVNNKLGVGEKKHCKKMLKDFYKKYVDFAKINPKDLPLGGSDMILLGEAKVEEAEMAKSYIEARVGGILFCML